MCLYAILEPIVYLICAVLIVLIYLWSDYYCGEDVSGKHVSKAGGAICQVWTRGRLEFWNGPVGVWKRLALQGEVGVFSHQPSKYLDLSLNR